MHQTTKNHVTIAYGLIHALIDKARVMVIFSAIPLRRLETKNSFYLVIGYDLPAFVGQVFCGHITDRLRFSRGAVLLGIVFTTLSVIALTMEPLTAMVFAGVGNAFFHVDAGAMTLHVKPGHATYPGLFVAPYSIYPSPIPNGIPSHLIKR